jgi:hypothetical protein
MNYLAVDFSLNSPGICIYNDKSKKYHFIAYMKPGTGSKKEQALQEQMSLLKDVTLIYQPDFTKEEQEFSSAELAKIKRYDRMADDIINLVLQESFKGDSFIIAFEGTSYGSKIGTNNVIDMAAGAAVLKLKLLKSLQPEDLMTVAPASIKKFAGKGSMNKEQLYAVFLANSIKDPQLEKSPFYQWIQSNQFGKKPPKPIDDLVDAYFLALKISQSPAS